MIQDQPIQQFLDELASKSATPGGGSAAAIMGAMGAALVGMVCNLTVGKKNYEAVEAEMADVLARADALRAQSIDMIRADIEAFDRVMAAYALPRETEEDKVARSTAIQEALKAATEVPLACARLCLDIIGLSETAAQKGNRNLISDAGVAVMAAHAALKSAALNVYVNAKGVKDEAFARERVDRLEALLEEGEAKAHAVFETVRANL
ncbi:MULTISPECIES: methenyltetrahydrofolate cyclohydrolase [Methylococcus]|jgi:formiminotetrahydrofolate cyclodeaminase|uniref:Methenyltetrahydrofolate cyclohydrolase n=2 Tax=Methylococcus capsulatus TaxID=414 RepID=Q60BH0_METCA|nr:methenyltetrahydrofolate cyclohydrolase [Methylococcus capsulatus]AAU93175.1 methenyltetrahydrofolate cyclohydrolase [Methylococcus capsulatus str. Bath]QXP88675.1 cyclodeaminase/cyclohydrolase family protein [Methylococcus capsulatus]QXP89940.1 cyclodeaminase/cyclohydrolase family protein [Methylococcus capsulatus]QXP94293.1 cyclodeaminase/cyclohydrolase family protein [Methylococcus capsulatus]UQN10951.1 cyclodeaminase/cyclohydrolase family protein [Methylococcus capsulatus]